MFELICDIAKRMKAYYEEIVNLEGLTSIQIKDYQLKIKKALELKGIQYLMYYDDISNFGIDKTNITFYENDCWVEDVGKIYDVKEKGAYPIILNVGDDIRVVYEPRDLSGMATKEALLWMKNTEFINLKQGSEYAIKGKVEYGKYYFKRTEVKFEFKIKFE